MSNARYLGLAAAAALVLVPLAVQSSQSPFSLADLAPAEPYVAIETGFGLFLDADEAQELTIRLPQSIGELDIDRDPFATIG